MKFQTDDKVITTNKTIIRFRGCHKNAVFTVSSIYSLRENRGTYYTLHSDDPDVHVLGHYFENELLRFTDLVEALLL